MDCGSRRDFLWEPQKLDLDLRRQSRLRGFMDEDARQLILQLTTRAAMIMEDAVPTALSPHHHEGGIEGAIAFLEVAVARMTALVGAAQALAQS
jgi:hypothetical protein